MAEVSLERQRPSLEGSRQTPHALVLDEVFELARRVGGVQLPLPVAAVDFVEPSGEVTGEETDSSFRVRAHAQEVPSEFSALRGDGMLGLAFAIQHRLGVDLSGLAPDIEPSLFGELTEVVGGASVYTVVDSGESLVARLTALREAYFMAHYDAAHRHDQPGLMVRAVRERFARVEGAPEGLTEDARDVRRLFSELFPLSLPENDRLFSDEFLEGLARPFYEARIHPKLLDGAPFRLKSHPPSVMERNVVPALIPEDVRVLSLEDETGVREKGPFDSLRPLFVSLLPPSISLEPWPRRIQAKYPHQWQDWVRQDPELEGRLARLPLVTADQLTILEESWQISLAAADRATLADFLNGHVEDVQPLVRLLRYLFSRYGVLARRMGRRVGASSGAVVFIHDVSHLDPYSRSLVEELGQVQSGLSEDSNQGLLTPKERQALLHFLDGRVEDAAFLSEILVKLEPVYPSHGHAIRELLKFFNKHGGIIFDPNHLEPEFEKFFQELSHNRLFPPHFSAGLSRVSLQTLAVQRVMGRSFSDYSSEAVSPTHETPPLSARDFAETLQHFIQGHARLAYLAWSRSRREIVGEDSRSGCESLELPPFQECRIQTMQTDRVLVRAVKPLPYDQVAEAVAGGRWVVFSRNRWMEVEPALPVEGAEGELQKSCFWVAPRQLALAFLWPHWLTPKESSAPSASVDLTGCERLLEKLQALISTQEIGARTVWLTMRETTGLTPEAHQDFVAQLLARAQEVGLVQTPTHLEFMNAEGQRCRIPRFPFRLSPAQGRFFDRLKVIAPFPLSEARPDRVLAQGLVERVAEWNPERLEFAIFEVEAMLRRHGNEVPFSSLLQLVFSRLPDSLKAIFRTPSKSLQPERFGVTTVSDRLEADFPDTFAFFHREALRVDMLESMDLITEAQVRDAGLLELWRVAPEDLPLVVELLNGRAQDTEEFRGLIQHILDTLEGTVLVWDVHRRDVDAATRSLLTQRAEAGVSGGVLMAVAVPYPSDELGVGIDLLAGPLHVAQEAFLANLRATRQINETLFGELRGWLVMVARHENTGRSSVLIQDCMKALLAAFNISDADAFWHGMATTRLKGKRMPLVATRFMELFLNVFLIQGEESVNRGYLDHAIPAWRMVYRSYEYLLAAMDCPAVPFDVNDGCEGKLLLPRVDAAFAFLGDFCLANDKVPSFEKPLDAIRQHLEWYRRFYGPNGGPVAEGSPVGRYLLMVEDYKFQKAEAYLRLVQQANYFLPPGSNMPYIDSWVNDLFKQAPHLVREEPAGYVLGESDFARANVAESRVLPQVAVMAMEAYYRIGLRAKASVDVAVLKSAVEGFRHFEHQVLLLLEGRGSGAWQWRYQAFLKMEHMKRQVVGDVDASEAHARSMINSLRGRSPEDPEWVRVQHWFAEGYRERFNQELQRIERAVVEAGNLPSSTWVESAVDEVLKALYVERRLIAQAEYIAGKESGSERVKDGEWLMYRCTELELTLSLMGFLARYPDLGLEGVMVAAAPTISAKVSRSAGLHSFDSGVEKLDSPAWFDRSLHDSLGEAQQKALDCVRSASQHQLWHAHYMLEVFDQFLSTSDKKDATVAGWRQEWQTLADQLSA